MQLDLQKKYPSVRSHELLPRKCWESVFLASERVGAFSKIYPELFPASPGAQLQEVTASTFSILGSNRTAIVHRIEKTRLSI